MTSVHPPFDVRIYHKECRSLANAGYDVTLIAPHTENENINGIRIKAIPKYVNRYRRMLYGTLTVYGVARTVNAELYHFHDPELIPVGLLLRMEGKRVLYDIHEDLPGTLSYKPYIHTWIRKPLEKLLDIGERFASHFFSGLIVANPMGVYRFRKHTRLALVQNFPLMEEFDVANTNPKPPLYENYVTYVGMRITRARGAEEIVRAIGLLPERLGVRMKLVGNIEPPELLHTLSQMPGWEHTDYLGTLGRQGVADVVRHARAGLVLLHPEPNYVTSQPVKLYEYMGAGIPVIASDFPVLRSFVEEARCGILVDPLNPRQIADAIQYLWTHPQEAEEMGERGRQAIRTQYNWANEEKELLRLYRQLCGSPLPA